LWYVCGVLQHQMITNRLIIIGLLFLILVRCGESNNTFDKEAEILTINFSRSIFSREIINSKEILDSLRTLSDTIYTDTSKYFRTPKATIFANNSAKTYFQVFEDPKGTITAMAFFKNKTELNVAEFYKNGQVMCKFSMTFDGVRNGNFFCYNEDGTFRSKGYYKNGTEVLDSSKTYKGE